MANGLGRGLSSLIPQKVNKPAAVLAADDKAAPAGPVVANGKALQADINKIKVNPMQPRKRFSDHEMEELVESIRLYGIIQPLIVSEKNGEYELIAGERRLRSAKMLNLATVPVIIREVDEQEKLEVALIENIQREDLNPIETAQALRKLSDEFSLNQEELAQRVSKSRSAVANTLRLLNLPEEIQLALMDSRITEGHAKLLVGVEGEGRQMALFRKIVHSGMTVSDSIGEARRLGGTKQARIKVNYVDKDKEFAFREFFGSKVEIRRKGSGGQVVIDFFSDEELEALVGKIKK